MKSEDKNALMITRWEELTVGLSEKTHIDYPGRTFYVNTKHDVVMEYEKKTKILWIALALWCVFQTEFNLNDKETRQFTQTMAKKNFKMRTITTRWRQGWMRLTTGEYLKKKPFNSMRIYEQRRTA